MSLYVWNRPVTRKQLESNYKLLHSYRNYAPMMARYSPPSTVGFSAVTANETVFRAGRAVVKAEKRQDKNTRLRRIRLLLERQRREKKLHDREMPSIKPSSSLSLVRQPALTAA